MRPKKEQPEKKQKDFTHIHMREEGVIGNEEVEEKIAHNKEEIEKGLRAIYKGDDADLGVVTKAKGGLTRMLGRMAIALFTLLLISIGGFFGITWWESTKKPEDAIEVSIAMPESIVSGEEVTIEISYKNPRNIALAQLALDVNLPKGFEMLSMLPAPTQEDQLIWKIGALGQHSDGKIALSGVWYADVPESERIQVIATYRPSNFNADFSKIETKNTSIERGVLTSTFSGPEKATAGELVTYTATFTNTGVAAINAEAELVFPQGFIPQKWNPEIKGGEGTVWSMETVQPGEVRTQTVEGTFASETSDLQEIKLISFIKNQEGENFVQGENTWFTDVTGGAVSVSLAGNGAVSQVSVAPGEQIRLSVQISNISEEAINDAQILLDFQPESGIPLNWSEAVLGKAKVTPLGVILSAEHVGTLAPNERKTFSFIFPIKKEMSDTQAKKFSVTAYVTSGGVRIQSLPLNIQMNANASLTSEARYFSDTGAPLGTGVFPPKVGSETGFLATWTIGRTLHALRDVTVTATLPQDVRFQGVRDASLGEVVFNEASRTLTWKIADIAADISVVKASIELTYVPGVEDVDTYGKLLSGSVLRALDGETGAIITAESSEVTTELPADTTAAGKGIVSD